MGVPNGTPANAARPVRVLSVPAIVPVNVIFLGPILGLNTHHYQKRTYPCLGDTRCQAAQHRTRIIWKGYAPVDFWSVLEEFWLPAVLEITEGLEHQLGGRKLAGEVWALSREGSENNSPVLGVYTETLREDECRPAFSILPTLERFYHQLGLEVGVPNPVPRQTRLEPREGRAPKMVRDLVAEQAASPVDDPDVMKRLMDRMRDTLKGKKSTPTVPVVPKPSTNGPSKGGGK